MTIHKCPECNALVLRPGSICGTCADRRATERKRAAAEHAERERTMRAIIDPRCAREWKKLKGEVEAYRSAHPAATMREACCAVLARRGCGETLKHLPEGK